MSKDHDGEFVVNRGPGGDDVIKEGSASNEVDDGWGRDRDGRSSPQPTKTADNCKFARKSLGSSGWCEPDSNASPEFATDRYSCGDDVTKEGSASNEVNVGWGRDRDVDVRCGDDVTKEGSASNEVEVGWGRDRDVDVPTYPVKVPGSWKFARRTLGFNFPLCDDAPCKKRKTGTKISLMKTDGKLAEDASSNIHADYPHPRNPYPNMFCSSHVSKHFDPYESSTDEDVDDRNDRGKNPSQNQALHYIIDRKPADVGGQDLHDYITNKNMSDTRTVGKKPLQDEEEQD